MFSKLKKSLKTYKSYKACHPAETIQRIKRGFAKLGLKVDEKIWRYGGAYISRVSLDKGLLVSYGKGTTRTLCRASGYAELAERFSAGAGLHHGPSHFKYARQLNSTAQYCSYNQLKNEKIGLDYFFASFRRKFRLEPGITRLARNFPLQWERAWSLTKRKYVWFPADWHMVTQATNGMGSGNTMAEAFVQATGEIFERYASTQTILERYTLPTIDPATVRNPELRRVLAVFRKGNIECIIKDCSLGLPLPTVGVLFIDKRCTSGNRFVNTRSRNFFLGTATDPEQAALRCFTEYVQCCWGQWEWAEEYWENWRQLGLPYRPQYRNRIHHQIKNTIRIYDESFLKKNQGTVSFADIPKRDNRDSLVELQQCLRGLARLGHEVLCVDHTHPVVRFPTVQVIIPGLQMVDVYPAIMDVYGDLAAKASGLRGDNLPRDMIRRYGNRRYRLSTESWLLTENWHTTIPGLRKAIKRLEQFNMDDPMCGGIILGIPVYELLAYLHIACGDYDAAYTYSTVIPRLLTGDVNDERSLTNYARLQEKLAGISGKYVQELLAHWLIRKMKEDGIPTNIATKWQNLGSKDTPHPLH